MYKTAGRWAYADFSTQWRAKSSLLTSRDHRHIDKMMHSSLTSSEFTAYPNQTYADLTAVGSISRSQDSPISQILKEHIYTTMYYHWTESPRLENTPNIRYLSWSGYASHSLGLRPEAYGLSIYTAFFYNMMVDSAFPLGTGTLQSQQPRQTLSNNIS
jgi:hypothetical protein